MSNEVDDEVGADVTAVLRNVTVDVESDAFVDALLSAVEDRVGRSADGTLVDESELSDSDETVIDLRDERFLSEVSTVESHVRSTHRRSPALSDVGITRSHQRKPVRVLATGNEPAAGADRAEVEPASDQEVGDIAGESAEVRAARVDLVEVEPVSDHEVGDSVGDIAEVSEPVGSRLFEQALGLVDPEVAPQTRTDTPERTRRAIASSPLVGRLERDPFDDVTTAPEPRGSARMANRSVLTWTAVVVLSIVFVTALLVLVL